MSAMNMKRFFQVGLTVLAVLGGVVALLAREIENSDISIGFDYHGGCGDGLYGWGDEIEIEVQGIFDRVEWEDDQTGFTWYATADTFGSQSIGVTVYQDGGEDTFWNSDTASYTVVTVDEIEGNDPTGPGCPVDLSVTSYDGDFSCLENEIIWYASDPSAVDFSAGGVGKEITVTPKNGFAGTVWITAHLRGVEVIKELTFPDYEITAPDQVCAEGAFDVSVEAVDGGDAPCAVEWSCTPPQAGSFSDISSAETTFTPTTFPLGSGLSSVTIQVRVGSNDSGSGFTSKVVQLQKIASLSASSGMDPWETITVTPITSTPVRMRRSLLTSGSVFRIATATILKPLGMLTILSRLMNAWI